MKLEIEIPDDKKDRVLSGICGQNGYQETVPDPENAEATIPNPESKDVFAKRIVMQFIKNNIITYEANRDIEAAKQAAISKAETEISLS